MDKNEWWCPTCGCYVPEEHIIKSTDTDPYHVSCGKIVYRKKIIPQKQPEKKLYPDRWETVSPSTIRLKVFGGWLVIACGPAAEHMCILPDPNHEWELEPEEKK